MEKQKLRKEIDEKYKWDLSYIFKNDKQIESAFKESEKISDELLKYKKIKLDENSLYELLSLDCKISIILEKLSLYASLKYSEDSTDNNNQNIYLTVSNFLEKMMIKLSFIKNRIYELDYEDVKTFIKKNDKLKEYAFMLEVMFKEKMHILSEKEEELISNLACSFSSPSDAYEALSYSDMTFGFVKNDEGKLVELTDSNYSLFSKSSKRKVRKDAFEKYYGTYGNFKNTMASLYVNHMKIE